MLKILLFLVLVFVFSYQFTQLWLSTDYKSWQQESESLVVGRMYQMQIGAHSYAGIMQSVTEPIPAMHELFLSSGASGDFENNTHYWHQIGFYASILGLLNKMLFQFGASAEFRLNLCYFINIFAFILVLSVICMWVYKEFGKIASLLVFTGTLFSNWTLKSIGNLYWVVFLYLLPFALSAYFCKKYETENKIPFHAVLIIALSVFVKFLSGFEFTSTLLICMEVPVMYYLFKHFKNKTNFKKYFSFALKTSIASIIAFIAAIIIWFVQIFIGFGDLQLAIEEFLLPIGMRTGFLRDLVDNDMPILVESLNAPIAEIFAIYLKQDSIYLGLNMQIILIIYLIITLPVILICKVFNKDTLFKINICLFATCFIAFLAPVSWFVLGRGHSYIHTHINYILWFMPLLPMMLLHLGYNIKTIFSFNFNKNGRA